MMHTTTNPQPTTSTSQAPRHYATRALERSTGGNSKRAELDFYPTPPEAVRALLAVEKFAGPIWEPACGDGAISKELHAAGHTVISTDLANRGFGQGGVDFLLENEPRARSIITNPPYGRGMADRFVLKALGFAAKTGGDVAMLLNLSSLCHPSRHSLFTKHVPSAIYALDELVCWPNGKEQDASRWTSKHRYCWLVWRRHHTGRPSFWWLNVSTFKGTETVTQEGGR